MTQHYIVSQDIAPEASWPVEHRVWASIQQTRRRASLNWRLLLAFAFCLVFWGGLAKFLWGLG